MDRLMFFFINITIIAIICIVLMNLFLIIGILTDSKIRGRLFFELILLIAVAHFLQGIFVIPLCVEIMSSDGIWTHHPDVCTFWHLTDLTLNTVLNILFLMLMFERFLSLTYPRIIRSKCLGLFMLLSPWVLATSFVVFLYYAQQRDFFEIFIDVMKGTERRDTCMLAHYVQRVYSFLGFIVPGVYITGFACGNVIILCLLRKRYAEGPSDENPRSHTTAASMVAMCFIAMWFPAHFGFFVPAEVSFRASNSIFIGFANAALTPTMWLIVPEIKRRFHRMCCCCCIACCGTSRQQGTVVSYVVEDVHVRMLANERIQPSTTTKL